MGVAEGKEQQRVPTETATSLYAILLEATEAQLPLVVRGIMICSNLVLGPEKSHTDFPNAAGIVSASLWSAFRYN